MRMPLETPFHCLQWVILYGCFESTSFFVSMSSCFLMASISMIPRTTASCKVSMLEEYHEKRSPVYGTFHLKLRTKLITLPSFRLFGSFDIYSSNIGFSMSVSFTVSVPIGKSLSTTIPIKTPPISPIVNETIRNAISIFCFPLLFYAYAIIRSLKYDQLPYVLYISTNDSGT